MNAARDLLITGLRNAHAMERQAQELMERQSERMTDFPSLQAKCREHLQETKVHLSRVAECLAKLGESPSALKDTALAFGANMAAMGHAMAGDEVLKNAFANNAFENYEVAAYKSLIILSEQVGMGLTPALQQNLREDERMAAWMADNVPALTLEFLRKQQRAAA
jgi:ferritin-like metal-binding protein YciE